MDPVSLIVLGLIGYVLLTSTNSAASAAANGQTTTNSLLSQLLGGKSSSSGGKSGSPGSTSGGPSTGAAGGSGGGNGSGLPTSLQDLDYDQQSAGTQALIDAQNNPLSDVSPTSSDTSSLGLISGDSPTSTYDQPSVVVPYDPDNSDFYDPVDYGDDGGDE